MNPMLQSFLSEARDLLDSANSCFLALEQQPEDKEILNDLFRSIHTLKGASGLFEIKPFTKTVHVAEDVLDKIREGKLVMTSDHVDVFLEVFDQISFWLDSLETEESLESDATSKSKYLIQKLEEILHNGEFSVYEESDTFDRGEESSPISEEDSSINSFTWLSNLPKIVLDQVFDKSQDDIRVIAVDYYPDEQCFYTGDDPFLTVLKSPGFLWMELNVNKEEISLLDFDPYKCCSSFHIICVARLEDVKEHFIYVEDQVKILPIESNDLLRNKEYVETRDKNHSNRLCFDVEYQKNIALKILEIQKEVLNLSCNPDIWKGRLSAAATVCNRIISRFGPQDVNNIATGLEESLRCHNVDSLVGTIDKILNKHESTSSDYSVSPPKSSQSKTFSTTSPKEKNVTSNRVQSFRSTVLKVDHKRIDALMDLAGELVVAKNSLPFLAKRTEEEFGLRELAREIKRHYAVINRIAEDLQSTVMQVSMIPISTVFQRFPRMVRDVSRKLNKKIRLVITGGETEADKNVVESLADPLVHLLRNSIDHGIESPEERVAVNKDETGEIRMQALYQNDQVIIEVSDDGRGIDPSLVKRKAYEKGIISEERLENISDYEAMQLILAPGFSTAEEVSDLSGRGVGMDVVKNVINQANGSLTIDSIQGKGTTIRMAMPLTMAVSRVMIVEVAGHSFGVRIDSIDETVRVSVDDIHQIKNREVVVLRNEIIPIYRLNTLLKLVEDKDRKDKAILVVMVNGMRLGLIVDGFQEGMDVILKPLEGVMSNFNLYSGTALLGDGRVLLILDLEELL